MIAVDTNILIYAENPEDGGERHRPASALLTQMAFYDAIIPVQVLGEFVNVCRKKKITTPALAAIKEIDFARIFETPQTQSDDIASAAVLADRRELQFFDALIITVASRAGATVLLSEYMQDRQQFEGLRVLNPFNPANQAEIEALLA